MVSEILERVRVYPDSRTYKEQSVLSFFKESPRVHPKMRCDQDAIFKIRQVFILCIVMKIYLAPSWKVTRTCMMAQNNVDMRILLKV